MKIKRHIKQKKLSRIRVAALKARKRRKEFKKNPGGIASREWQKYVINCTIPPANLDAGHFKEVEQFGHKMFINTEIRDDGNGKMWPKGGEPYYVSIREKAKKFIRDNISHMEKNADGEEVMVGKYKYKGKRKPWYMLDTRKTYHYEERQKSWGAHTDFFRVPSEATEMYNRTVLKKMSRCAFMEALVQHKLAKWLRKPGNQRPIKENCQEPDLFEAQYIPEWEAKRNLAEERFRDFVVSVYDKLHVVGNRVNRKEGKMVGTTVAEVKDTDGKGHDVTYPNLQESDKLYKDATKAAVVAMDKDPTIVDCDLKNHKGDQKRPLIHAKRSGSKNLKQQREFRKAA